MCFLSPNDRPTTCKFDAADRTVTGIPKNSVPRFISIQVLVLAHSATSKVYGVGHESCFGKFQT